MKRSMQIALVGVLMLVGAAVAVAQQSTQPVIRMGNWIEVGNELFMHILASADIRYRTTEQYDFEKRIREQVNSRSPTSSTSHEGQSDLSYAELRLGAEFRYQKSLYARVLFEHQQIFDGNLIDDRSNTSNPGGTDVFGRAASTENPGFHIEQYYIDYKFLGTPIRMRVGADSWSTDQALLLRDDDPRFALFAEFGNLDVYAAAVIQAESQRLGLTNDNDLIFYTFGVGYNLKPHRFQLDIAYFRDRFSGADTQASSRALNVASAPIGFVGQKVDSVGIMASWKGKVGPVDGLLQGNFVIGTARGGVGPGLPAGVAARRDYDILGFGVVAKAELDLGIVKPFVGLLFASGDGDPTDDKLHGYHFSSVTDSGSGIASQVFSALDTSPAFGGGRDYACPAQMRGAAPRAGSPVTAIGNNVFSGVSECSHTIDQPFNDRVGTRSHPGILSVYSNPGTLAIPVGVRVFPVKGHEIDAYYLYKAFITTNLLEVAYNLPAGRIDKTQVHEIGGYWLWTLNPHFDIRLAGHLGFAGSGYRDLARLADCNPNAAGTQPCQGDDVALSAEARLRARF